MDGIDKAEPVGRVASRRDGCGWDEVEDVILSFFKVFCSLLTSSYLSRPLLANIVGMMLPARARWLTSAWVRGPKKSSAKSGSRFSSFDVNFFQKLASSVTADLVAVQRVVSFPIRSTTDVASRSWIEGVCNVRVGMKVRSGWARS